MALCLSSCLIYGASAIAVCGLRAGLETCTRGVRCVWLIRSLFGAAESWTEEARAQVVKVSPVSNYAQWLLERSGPHSVFQTVAALLIKLVAEN